jgi:hypothetical protein
MSPINRLGFPRIPFSRNRVIGQSESHKTKSSEVVTPAATSHWSKVVSSLAVARPGPTIWQLDKALDQWPVHSIPIEIIQLIFQHLYTSHTRAQRRIRAVTIIRLVCRSWNETALNLPDLWTTVLIRRGPAGVPRTPASWIRRAGNLPLDVVLYADSFVLGVSIYEVGMLPTAVSAVVPTASRWRSLTVFLTLPDAARLLANVLAPRIKRDIAIKSLHLRLEAPYLPTSVDQALIEQVLSSSTLSIRLTGRRIGEVQSLNVENVRSLEFGTRHLSKISYDAFVQLTERAPRLELLDLGCVTIGDMPDVDKGTPVCLASLRSFSTAASYSLYTSNLLYRLFKLFLMPELESLALSDLGEESFRSFLNVLEEEKSEIGLSSYHQSFDKPVWPRLRTLRFAFTGRNYSRTPRFPLKEAYPRLFTALPAVRHLFLIDIQTTAWMNLLIESICGGTIFADGSTSMTNNQPTLLWPYLRAITLGGHNHLEGPLNPFMILANRRHEKGVPLECVHIERTWLRTIPLNVYRQLLKSGVAIIPYDREDSDGLGDGDW